VRCNGRGVGVLKGRLHRAQSIRLGEFIPSRPATARSRRRPLVRSVCPSGRSERGISPHRWSRYTRGKNDAAGNGAAAAEAPRREALAHIAATGYSDRIQIRDQRVESLTDVERFDLVYPPQVFSSEDAFVQGLATV
jgi:hypothetical protein